MDWEKGASWSLFSVRLCVLCGSVVDDLAIAHTESQRTQRLHRELKARALKKAVQFWRRNRYTAGDERADLRNFTT